MASSAINISANAQEVISLKKRIEELRTALAGMKRSADPAAYDKLNRELQTSSIRCNRLVGDLQRYVSQQQQAERATRGTASSMSEMQSILAKIGGTAAFIGLGKQIMDVRNEFQQLEIAFGTMLKSTEKASSLMKDLTKFAAETPFGLQSAASGAKQLLAYGSTADSVIGELTMLGDVAAGTGQSINDLVYLYGTLRTQGRAYLMDIRQFAGRGVPIYDELAKVLKINKDEVNGFVSAGKVGFTEVEQAFKNMTSQGGLYGGLMEQQSKSIGGRLEALKDNLDSIFNTIGKDSEGIIYKSIDGLNILAENYETIGKILVGLIATYGTYRTAVIAVNLIMKEQAAINAMVAASNGVFNKSLAYQWVWTGRVQQAQALLNKTMLSNPYVAVTVALVGLVATVWALRDSTSAAEKAQADFNKTKEDAVQKEEEHRNEIEKLITSSTNQALADLERIDALEKLKQKYPQIFKQYTIETLRLEQILSIKKQIAEIDAGEKVKTNKSDYDKAKDEAKKATDYYNRLKNYRAGYQGYGQALDDAKYEMDYANNILKNAEREVQNDRINSFISGISKMTDAQIKAELTARQRLQAEMQYKGAKTGTTKGGILDGEFNTDQIKQQADALTSELTKRKVPIKSYIEWEKQYNNELKALQNDRKKIEKNSAKVSEADLKKQLENIDSQIKMKQDQIKDLTTKTPKQQDQENSKAETAAEKARKTAQKVLDDQLKSDNDKAKASLDARNQELENQQALLNLQEDGFKKEQKQAEINHQKELLSIDKRAQELIEAKQKAERDAWDIKNPNPKTTYVNKTTSIMDLSPEQQASLISADAISTKGLEKANADLLKNLLEKYQDFAAKKTAIEKQYNKDVQALESQRTAQNSAEIDRAVAQLNKERKEATSAIDLNAFKESINWEQVFGDLDKVSTSALEGLREKLRKYIQSAGNNISIQDLKVLNDALDNINNKLNVKNPFSELKAGFKDLGSAANDAAKQVKAVNKITESLNEVMSYADAATQSFTDLADVGIFSEKDAKNVEDVMGYLQGSVTASAGLGKVMSGDMSGIKDMISGTSQMIKSVASLFAKRDKAAEDTKQLQDITSKIEVTNKSINSLIEKRIDLINDATAAEAGYLNTLTQEQIKTQQEYVQGMFDRLSGNEIFGKKGKNNNLTLTALMDREGLTSMDDFVKWWNEEGGVAKLTAEGYDLKNEDQWQSIIDAWSSLKDAAEDAETAMKEAATGISFDDLKDSLDDLVQDVNTTFSDISDSFEDNMRNAVMNFVKSSYLTKALQDWYDKFAEAYSDDVLTSDEVDALQNMYNEAYNKAQDMYDSALKAAGVSKGSTSQSASSGYSTSMSQDTGEAIEGRMTAMQMNLISIDANVARIAEWSQPFDMKYNVDVLTAPLSALSESCQRIELMLEQNRNIAIQSYYELKDINKQTKELYPMRIDTQAIRKSLESL